MGTKNHIDKETFKQIFIDHWDSFKSHSPRYDTDYHDEVIQKMLDCGDPDKMGFVQYRCTACGEKRRIAFTCKSCFCLSCAKPYTDQWIDFIERRLFPGVTYRHIVLTTPEFLRNWFYHNPDILSPFMQAGHACLRDVLNTYTGVNLDIGTVVVLQTAGRAANYNVHLHILLAAGGITPEDKWKQVSYIPYDMFHRKWQYYLLSMLRENISDPAVEKDIDHAWKAYPKGFVAYVQEGEVPAGGKGLARYLAKYLVSPPISVRRIELYDGHRVRYRYRDHKTGDIQHETISVFRFIGRMVQHILPKGFQRIRYYGLHSNVRYAEERKHLARILPEHHRDDPRGFYVLQRKPFAQLFFETFNLDPLLCPRCGKIMTLELIKHPEYGIIKEYPLGKEVHPGQRELPPEGSSLECSQRVVQIPLPFL